MSRGGQRPALQGVTMSLLAILAIVALRAQFYHGDVLKSDEAIYAVEARAWSSGLLPGRGIWDNKPPGMAALYLLGSRLPGGTIAGTRLLALLFSVTTLLLTLRLCRLIAPGSPSYPVALAYVLITHANGWPPGEWIVLNGELPATCFVTLAAWCLAEWGHRQRQLEGVGPCRLWPLIPLAGLFGGSAVFFRQTALVPLAAMAILLVWATARRGGASTALKATGAAVTGVLLSALPFGWYYWSQEALQYFWYAVMGHGMAYAAQSAVPADRWRSLREGLGVGVMPELLVLALLGFAFAVAGGLRPQPASSRRAVRLLVIAWGVGSLLSVLPGGHLFGHYFLQFAPAWALASGLAVARLCGFAGTSIIRFAGCAATAVGAFLVAGRLWGLQPSGPQIACLWFAIWLAAAVVETARVRTTLANIALPAALLILALSIATGVASSGARPANHGIFTAVAAQIRARTTPSDRILVWAWAPQVYWYSDRLPACRDITLNYSLGWIGRRPGELFTGARAALMEDLRRTPPRLIAVPTDDLLPYSNSPGWERQAAPEIWAYIGSHYRIVSRIPHWDLYVLTRKYVPGITGV